MKSDEGSTSLVMHCSELVTLEGGVGLWQTMPQLPISRVQVPETPQEYVGQHLLFAYLEQFVQSVGGTMYLEVQTGRGRMDILIRHNHRKYIVETKIWGGDVRYQTGKAQLAAYLKLEKAVAGYYVVFDHRTQPESRAETDTIDGLTIRSYVIPVVQEIPSQQTTV